MPNVRIAEKSDIFLKSLGVVQVQVMMAVLMIMVMFKMKMVVGLAQNAEINIA